MEVPVIAPWWVLLVPIGLGVVLALLLGLLPDWWLTRRDQRRWHRGEEERRRQWAEEDRRQALKRQLAELEALFQYARDHDVERGGRYDARSAAVNIWFHHWQHPATREESEVIGTFYVRWTEPPTLWAIETETGFSLEDLMQELGRLELQALGRVTHGDIPQDRRQDR